PAIPSAPIRVIRGSIFRHPSSSTADSLPLALRGDRRRLRFMFSSEEALEALRAAVPAEILATDGEALYRASFDNLRISRTPSVVIRPRTEDDIATVLRLANEHHAPVT